jgi:hypothetical protein
LVCSFWCSFFYKYSETFVALSSCLGYKYKREQKKGLQPTKERSIKMDKRVEQFTNELAVNIANKMLDDEPALKGYALDWPQIRDRIKPMLPVSPKLNAGEQNILASKVEFCFECVRAGFPMPNKDWKIVLASGSKYQISPIQTRLENQKEGFTVGGIAKPQKKKRYGVVVTCTSISQSFITVEAADADEAHDAALEIAKKGEQEIKMNHLIGLREIPWQTTGETFEVSTITNENGIPAKE